ncbi:protein-L-isoaspartate(D-aspartate) O-methyltransferase [Paraburkholderia sp. RAU2J]|uniref:protein-L-isoaspartate O-methyltransferase family protein n=1 Tax=Paraburkholderia sp. RAU2J TaxID=1938810 RepID=UPI000EB15FF9|nr:methyltransferase domain-containing protein [Paraburkholderia sp. RAU2J]RKT21154.1 protein-L-isoaspartate(D-aspartate) O-methyltransferase [Paraburkholderia sp. RAU2J]
MNFNKRADVAEIRAFHAKLMAAASKSIDPRLERVFELVPREAFLPPGPWKVMVDNRYFETPSDDPAYLYQNALIALDATKGINNGEPFLHAAWIGATSPKSGDTVSHIGIGAGYYTAILSALVVPGGRVEAFEIDPALAEKARDNLRAFEGVSVTHGDATTLPVPSSDLIYVNAGVKVLPRSWLLALRPQGRLIFPWRPSEKVGVAVLLTRTDAGFAARPFMPSWFIPCVGGAGTFDDAVKDPTLDDAWAIQSVWLTSDRAPDETCVAAYRHLWFSSSPLH